MAIHPNIARIDYDALPGINWSKLKRGVGKTAAHITTPSGGDKPAYKFGRAFHHAVLQPELFGGWEVVAGKTTTKPGAITEAERSDIEAMAANAAALHGGHLSHLECAVTWKHAGRDCKALIDGIWKQTWLMDAKSTQNAAPKAFDAEIYKFSYYGQAAWYLDGLEANGIALDGAALLAVEKTPPYAAGFHFLSDAWIDMGRRLYEDALVVLAAGQNSYGCIDSEPPEWCGWSFTEDEDGISL